MSSTSDNGERVDLAEYKAGEFYARTRQALLDWTCSRAMPNWANITGP